MAPSQPPGLDRLPSLQRRLVYSLLRPAVRLCRLFRLPLKALEELARLAYFEELRGRGEATQAEVAELLGTSLRTVTNLASRYRGDFLSPEHEVEAARRIEAALTEGPAKAAELAAKVRLTEADVSRLLAGMDGAGRVRRQDDGQPDARWEIDWRYVSLVEDDVQARIDGLNHQLDVVLATIRTRFLAGPTAQGVDAPPAAMARTLSFVCTSEGMQTLADDLVRHLRRRCGDAEEDALRAGARDPYAVTLALAPMKDGSGSRSTP